MKKGTKYALILGAIPFVTLVFALPLVNRVHPVVLGLPFLLFWILTWVILTPFILFLAYVLEKKFNPADHYFCSHSYFLVSRSLCRQKYRDELRKLDSRRPALWNNHNLAAHGRRDIYHFYFFRG